MNIKINNCELDDAQNKIATSNEKHILVTAGAGSGKTFTILGKIYYLINTKKLLPEEILCISFTRESSNSLKEKIKKYFNLNIDVYTFHKLSLNILKELNIEYEITFDDVLDNIIHEYIYNDIRNSNYHMKLFMKLLSYEYSFNILKSYNIFLKEKYNDIKLIENTFVTFIRLFKCNNYKLEDFIKFNKEAQNIINIFKYKKDKIFLIFALNFYLMYENYLKENNEIDFDDMIIKATKVVSKLNFKYKYIIIDEYQDTSYVRFLLIQEILNKTNASLMVVGDDFQSIYKFTGCDLSLFIDFKKYFKDAKIYKIENTYRNSNELINIAGNFIMKNKSQIKKNLKSNKNIENPINIILYNDFIKSFEELILSIYNETNKPIMVLGRNNKDINLFKSTMFKIKDNNIMYLKNKEIKLYYLTVHKSKGLEEENVIIINVSNKKLGFPNKIDNNRYIRFVSIKEENYKYAEERRLFYVALTRTKNKVYIMSPINNESIFVKELIKENIIDTKKSK